MKQSIKKKLKRFVLYKKWNAFRSSQVSKKFVGIKEYIFNYNAIKIFSILLMIIRIHGFPRYRNGKIHEPHVTRLFIENINENDTVLDIGAHIGYFTCISSYLASNGSVHAFEVDPKCIPLINKNLVLNNFNNVKVNNKAVSNNTGYEKIPVFDEPSPALRISNTREKFIEIPSITIDDYIISNKITPNFIKIDVEGAEWMVLNGMKDTLKQKHLKMLVEVHAKFLKNNFNTDYREVIKLLIENGFTIKEIIDHKSKKIKFRNIGLTDTLSSINTMLYCEKY